MSDLWGFGWYAVATQTDPRMGRKIVWGLGRHLRYLQAVISYADYFGCAMLLIFVAYKIYLFPPPRFSSLMYYIHHNNKS